MSRFMYRYAVPVDDSPHTFELTDREDPAAVAAVGTSAGDHVVEFWAEHDDSLPGVSRTFQVFGTGHPLPADARWVGTCDRFVGLVWHLYEVTP